MKTITILALLLMTCCTKGNLVQNKINIEDPISISHIATTPEGIKIYQVMNGYGTFLAVSADGKTFSLASH